MLILFNEFGTHRQEASHRIRWRKRPPADAGRSAVDLRAGPLPSFRGAWGAFVGSLL